MKPRRNTNFLTVPVLPSPASFIPTMDGSAEKQFGTLPPLSPLLPTTRLKVNKSEERSFYRRYAARLVVAITLSLVFLWQASNIFTAVKDFQTPLPISTNTTQLADLPKHATAITVNGGSKWTVSIPHDSAFPLSSNDYTHICRTTETVRDDIRTTTQPSGVSGWWADSDRSFLDVAEAQAMGFLPANNNQTSQENVCEKSLTFVLESDDISFGGSLLMMWLSYGLAQRQGRAFFLDDSRWAWSKYTSYFQPPPRPQCNPPPAHHIVSCPAIARHIVVSSSTAQWTFGPAFKAQYMRSNRFVREQQTQVFALVRAGYDALFHLADTDAGYVDERVSHFRGDAQNAQAPVVGVHIRRGDRHPFEYQYSHDYLPLSRYVDAAYEMLPSLAKKPTSQIFSSITSFLSAPVHPSQPIASTPNLVLASDDPDIHLSDELLLALSAHDASPESLTRAQDRILLATKSALDAAANLTATKSLPRGPHAPHDGHTAIQYHKHVAENAGWDGGFYAAMFASLGNVGGPVSTTPQALEMRILVGRAYVLDVAVLARASDAAVCAISSASCRVLGVAMGWEGVRSGGKWVNVDDGRGWSWDGNGP